jgi:hypothetical protein
MSFGATVLSQDVKNQCTIFRATNQGTPQLKSESLNDDREIYGFVFQNMQVDFDRQIVIVDAVKSVVLGLDKPVVNGPVFISKKNPNFEFLINRLNRTFHVMDQICISQNNEIIWATATK